MADEQPKSPQGFQPSLMDVVPTTPAEIVAQVKDRQSEHNHYAAIGRVAASWSYLEALIDTYSIELAGLLPETGVCLTAQVAGSGRKLDAYIALARYQRALPPKLVAALNEFAKTANSLAERRNRTLHDAWYFNHPHPPQRLEATARKLLRLVFIPTSTEDLLKLAQAIHDAAEEFTRLAMTVEIAPRPSPETQP